MINLKKTLSIVVVYSLINLIVPYYGAIVSGAQNPTQTADTTEQVKSAVRQIGTDPDVHVKVTLRNGTKVKGYISAFGPDSFSVTKEGATKTTIIQYADVVKIEKSKSKLPGRHSSFWPILIGVGIVVFAVVVLGVSERKERQ